MLGLKTFGKRHFCHPGLWNSFFGGYLAATWRFWINMIIWILNNSSKEREFSKKIFAFTSFDDKMYRSHANRAMKASSQKKKIKYCQKHNGPQGLSDKPKTQYIQFSSCHQAVAWPFSSYTKHKSKILSCYHQGDYQTGPKLSPSCQNIWPEMCWRETSWVWQTCPPNGDVDDIKMIMVNVSNYL